MPSAPDNDAITGSWSDWAIDRVLRVMIGGALKLPYEQRVPLFGKISRRIIAPLAGYTRRSRENLARIWPEMPKAQRNAIARRVSENAGRVLIENYSNPEFIQRAAQFSCTGPGLAAIDEARAAGRSVIVVSGHYGNYEAARACLNARGYEMGGLYRPMSNAYFNRHYVRTMEAVGTPMFALGRSGMKGMLRHLSRGGSTMLLNDLHVKKGRRLNFLGLPAMTAISAAEMALKYDAVLVPVWATRIDRGLDYRIEVDAPIPHGDPEVMTQAFNDALGARIRADPEQWFWVHRRWKAPGARHRPAASVIG
ncbi:MAG: lysophospholipid acyltransferase family protein [Celeribacter sp.]|jgi:KDO2-lipid IV(A) lauroyltransferase